MKISLIVLLFLIFNTNVFSKTAHVFYKNSNEKQQILKSLKSIPFTIKIKDFYSPSEKLLLPKNIQSNILTVSYEEQDSKRLKSILSNYKTEFIPTLELQSNYSKLQWHLDNPGGNIETRTSDIDTITIATSSEADLHLEQIPKETNKVIKIAVIDSGIDTKHFDLKNQILTNENECKLLEEYQTCLESSDSSEDKLCHEKFASQDSNNNGYPLDCHGWNLTDDSYPGVKIDGSPNLNDIVGHGTHVAGLIAAENNNQGTNGVIQNAKIIPIQIAQSGSSSDGIDIIAKGILYAIKNDVDIINLSLGWKFQNDSTVVREMIKAAQERDILVVVAAGNNSHSDLSYPCAYDDVICVGAFDKTGNLASYSNRGTQVDIIAPGTDLLSTWPSTIRSRLFNQDNRFDYLSGTSQATPLVSGALAKLLNHGHTPNQAKIALLKGAEKKLSNHGYRQGNINLSNSFKVKDFSFIYPLNKAPYLVQWTKENPKKIRLKLKNYGNQTKNVKFALKPLNPDIKILNDTFNISSLKSNEVFTKDIFFESSYIRDSEIQFQLNIISESFKKEYTITAHSIRLLTPSVIPEDFEKTSIAGNIPPGVKLKEFDNLVQDNKVDFLAVRNKGAKSYLSIFQKTDESYIVSKEISLRENFPVFLNQTKVDLDLDGKKDYVITYVYVEKESRNKITKFLIFDDQLKPKRYLISPNNTFANDKTFIPGIYKWLPFEDKLVPTWIGFGENAQDLNTSPWTNYGTQKSNYIYYLTADGLKHKVLPSNDELPLHFLFQSPNSIQNHSAFFITSLGDGFVKRYFLYKYSDQIEKITEIKFNDNYFDFFTPRPLPLNYRSDNGVFQMESLFGNMYSMVLSYDGAIQKDLSLIKNITPNESIKYLGHVSDDYFLYQTNHKLTLYNRNTQESVTRESKVDTRRRRLQTLYYTPGYFLPASESPGFTSEVFEAHQENEFISNTKFRIFPAQGCSEIGLVQTAQEEKIYYICTDGQKILSLTI